MALKVAQEYISTKMVTNMMESGCKGIGRVRERVGIRQEIGMRVCGKSRSMTVWGPTFILTAVSIMETSMTAKSKAMVG